MIEDELRIREEKGECPGRGWYGKRIGPERVTISWMLILAILADQPSKEPRLSSIELLEQYEKRAYSCGLPPMELNSLHHSYKWLERRRLLVVDRHRGRANKAQITPHGVKLLSKVAAAIGA